LLWAGRSGVRTPVRGQIFGPILEAHPASWVYSDWGVALTTHPFLAAELGMDGGVPLTFLVASLARNGTTFMFTGSSIWPQQWEIWDRHE
jgi:hypothetical protein